MELLSPLNAEMLPVNVSAIAFALVLGITVLLAKDKPEHFPVRINEPP